MSIVKIDRRTLLLSGLSAGAAGGAGLWLGIQYGRRKERWAKRVPPRPNAFSPSVYLAVDRDDTVTIWLTKAEVGQGVYTALPMLVAEELEADWQTIRVEQAIANLNFGDQMVATSASVRSLWLELRQAGATARQMLCTAAAEQWGVDVGECRAANGSIIHEPTGRRVRFGAVAEAAASLDVPAEPALKDPSAFTMVGARMPRLDTPLKVDGSARFGIDVRRAGMLYACVGRSPTFGGKLVRFDASRARAVRGVKTVVSIKSGVAVVADGTWPALEGRRALEIEWDAANTDTLSSKVVTDRLQERIKGKGVVARAKNDVDAALNAAVRKVDASYAMPYLAHATMEPMNATADVREDSCELWLPTQHPAGAQDLAAEMTGIAKTSIVVNTTFVGGAFGRRVEQDVTAEAIELSQAMGRPVQVIWTREDDTRHDWYRPPSLHALSAGLDAEGWPTSWSHRCATPSIVARDPSFKEPVDPVAVEGGVENPYRFDAFRYTWMRADLGVPTGFWRSVGHSHNALAVECFIDEVAKAGGKDPVALRRRLLAEQPRHLGVLDALINHAGPVPAEHHRGLAVHASYGSYVAMAADIQVDAEGRPTVRSVVSAVDCGQVVNPDTVVAQIEGGIMFGLTAALYGRIDFERGRVVQGNFHNYRMLRIDEAPRVEVHIVDSAEPPGGVGEIAVPPIGPAVANAVFSATGQPVRSLPLLG